MAEDPHKPPISVYEAAERLLPARTWTDNPLIWIGLVVAVFLAVPFLADWATRGTARSPAKPGAQTAASAPTSASAQVAASAPASAAAPMGAQGAAPQRDAPAAAGTAAPAPLRAQAEPTRQMITKCIEGGRVVYTQTGECAGSVTAVPIDTSKNVIGPSGASAPR